MPSVTSESQSTRWMSAGAMVFAAIAIAAELGTVAYNAGLPVPLADRAIARASLFWLSRKGPHGDRTLAQIASLRGPVMHRGSESPVWESAASDTLIHAHESLRTLEHGATTVALYDGSELALDENSTVELAEASPRTISLDLVSGSIQRRASQASSRHVGFSPLITIAVTGGATITAPATAQFSLRRRAEGERLELHVLDGSVDLHSTTGNFALKAGEEAIQTAANEGAFEFRKMPFVLVAPRAAVAATSSPAHFEWNVDPALTGGAPLELQIAYDPAFARIAMTSRIASTEPPLRHVVEKVALPSDLRASIWYWRVRAVTDGTVVSDASAFWAPSETEETPLASDPLARPRLRLPLDSAVAANDRPLDLVWSAVPGASAYEVDVEGHDQPWVTPSLGVAVNAAELPLGRRLWRVRARLPHAALSPWSDPRAVTVIAAENSDSSPRRPASSHP